MTFYGRNYEFIFFKNQKLFYFIRYKNKIFLYKNTKQTFRKTKKSNQNAETQSQSEDFSQKNSQSSQNADYTEFSIPVSEPNSENQTKTVNVEKISKKILSFFLNFFDTLFEIAFFCGIFFILRPDFLNNSEYIWTASFNFEFLKSFTFLGINQIFIPHSEISRTKLIFIFSLISYFVLLSCFDKTFQFLNSALLKEIHLPIRWF